MAEHCRNCGSELFTGQRFCRACGAPSELSPEQTPTQMMPPRPNDWGSRGAANTAPANSQNTSPVYAPPGGYQPSVPPMYPQTIPPYTPPQKRSPVGWILAFIGMGLFVAVVVAVMLIARAGRRAFPPPGPPPPPLVLQPGENALDQSADQVTVTGSDTVLIKTFPLVPGSSFSIKNISGSISVEAWDQPKAEVKVTKRTSDNGSQVIFTNNAGDLSLRTAISGGRNRQDVRYEVKIPKTMGRVEFQSTNGSVKLTNVNGEISVETANGGIELNDVVGASRVQTANGKITATLSEASDGPMELSVANGRIDLTLKSDFDADLEASTVSGSINIDDQYGIPVQKGVVGSRARGKIGSGGQTLKLASVNGSIKVTKQ